MYFDIPAMGLGFGFDKPAFLLLAVIGLPLLWVFSFKSLSGLGNARRLLALVLRSIVFAAIVLALAEVQMRKTSDKMTVIYLLDQSQSVPLPKRQAMLRYVVKEVAKHRNADRADRAGVIVFGREALIEVPPFEDDIPVIGGIESGLQLRTDATNLAAALKLAQASFPEDTAKRVVVVTDGNENLGSARAIAPMLRDAGIGVDVVPVEIESYGEVDVEKVTLPPDIRRGQPVDTRVVVNNYSDQPITGKLKISRRVGAQDELLDEPAVTLKPGKNVFSFEHTIDQPAVYTYRADFTADDPAADMMKQNNTATAFTYVRGKGRILLIEDWDNKGDFDLLVERLRANNLEVLVRATDDLFTSLAELQAFDAVILAGTPRTSGDDAKTLTNFSDEQIEMLVRNTQQMGSGLIMLGGPNAFGAGGWSNTELEKAMPVDFQIKNSKIQAVGALVLMMHASELAQGNYWQKVIAQKSIESLGPMDYCGLLHWGNTTGQDEWLWGGNQGLIRISGKRRSMLQRLGRMAPGDMPQFEPAMRKALTAFRRVNASVKHMIVISDGDPSPARATTVASYRQAGIQISTVAVGTHGPAGSTPLQRLATSTGGKYYVVTNPNALPKIYQREVRRISRPLIYEPDGGVQPVVTYDHEMHDFSVGDSLPNIRGFVLTTLKQNPLVEQSIVSPKPSDSANGTILATWTYGLGRTAVLTTDAGKRWSNSWTSWEDYDKFFTQLVRWAMRPVDENGKFTVATDYKDGRVSVVVTALDKDDEFLNFLEMSGSVVGPDLKASDIKIRQIAPGRYVGDFDADESGSFFVTINPGTEIDEQGKQRARAPLLTGVTVPYSAEFRDRETNRALIEALAQTTPKGGKPGAVIDGDVRPETIETLMQTDTFRHTLAKAVSSQDVWPLFILFCACIFFADVFIRRVTLSYDWIEPGVLWFREHVLGRGRAPQEDDRMARLRSRKAAVSGQIAERRAAARFEPQLDANAPAPSLDQLVGDTAPADRAPPPPASADLTPGEAETDDSYTSRLMQAKKKAWKDRNS